MYVTTASCLLFAEHVAAMQRAQSTKILLAQDVDPTFKLRMADAVVRP